MTARAPDSADRRPWRLFVAVELPALLRDGLGRVVRRLQGRVAAPVRWVAPAAMHLTLRFLGDTPPDEVDTVRASLRAAAAPHPPHQSAVFGLSAFPTPRRPRVLVARLAPEPALLALAQAVEEAAREVGFRAEGRTFRPHITLGRIPAPRRRRRRRGRRPGPGAATDLGPALAAARPLPQEPLPVGAVSLMRSELRPDGPRYHLVERFFLLG